MLEPSSDRSWSSGCQPLPSLQDRSYGLQFFEPHLLHNPLMPCLCKRANFCVDEEFHYHDCRSMPLESWANLQALNPTPQLAACEPRCKSSVCPARSTKLASETSQSSVRAGHAGNNKLE